MAEDVFKLPGSGYDTVAKVIMAYSEVGQTTGLSAISQIMGTDQTVASRNTGFLLSVGLLEGGRDKGPTALGMRLGRALQFNEAGDIASTWREVLAPQPFIQRILAAIRVRGGMDASTLQTQIVYTAGASKSAGALRGGGAVLEMLKASGLITDRDGRFTAMAQADLSSTTDSGEDDYEAEAAASAPTTIQRILEERVDAGGVSVTINVDLRVEVGVDQLGAAGAGIRALLREIKEESSGRSSDGTVNSRS